VPGSSVKGVLDPRASRETAHIFLDAVAVNNRRDPTDGATRDNMTALALQRLTEVGSILLTQDDETGRISLDISRAQTGIIAVIIACLDGWAACSGVDRDQLIAEVRNIIDNSLTDDQAD
jgi:hypothetical protein